VAHPTFDARDWVDRNLRNLPPARAIHHSRRRRRIHDLHGAGLVEQGVRNGVELLVGLGLKHVHCARREDEGEGLQELQGADNAGDEG
jgi:hypothetical protein